MDDHHNTNNLTGGYHDSTLMPPSKTVAGRALANSRHLDGHRSHLTSYAHARDGVGVALSDSPVSTAPSSPQMLVSILLFSFYLLLSLLIV